MTSEHGFTDSARSSWSIHHFQQSRADQMLITVSIQPASSNPSIHRGSWETFHKVIPPKDVHLSERSWASRRCSMMKVIARPVSPPQKRRLLVACPQQRASVTCAASTDETVHNCSGSTYGLPKMACSNLTESLKCHCPCLSAQYCPGLAHALSCVWHQCI